MSTSLVDLQHNTPASKINLLGMNISLLKEFFTELGEKSFHAVQVLKWIHQKRMTDFAAMTNLSKSLRAKLQEMCVVKPPEIADQQKSKDGTYKWLIALADGNVVETVFMPEANRGTLCISSQVGCALNCAFCFTTRQGFNRNLTAAEIIGQVWLAHEQLSKLTEQQYKITNIVLMGMGEPLLNFDAVAFALSIIRDDNAYGLAKRRVTVSTSGIVPGIDKLAKCSDVALAISLHAPNDLLRNTLVPMNKKYPIMEVIAACKRYVESHNRHKITVEYVMLDGVNDKKEHAKQLLQILQGVPCKVNLIPFNYFLGALYKCSKPQAFTLFSEILNKAGIVTTTRLTRGSDIAAACGQLVGKVIDRTSRSARFLQQSMALA